MRPRCSTPAAVRAPRGALRSAPACRPRPLHEPGVADHVGGQDGGEPPLGPRCSHVPPPAGGRSARLPVHRRQRIIHPPDLLDDGRPGRRSRRTASGSGCARRRSGRSPLAMTRAKESYRAGAVAGSAWLLAPSTSSPAGRLYTRQPRTGRQRLTGVASFPLPGSGPTWRGCADRLPGCR